MEKWEFDTYSWLNIFQSLKWNGEVYHSQYGGVLLVPLAEFSKDVHLTIDSFEE